MQNRIIFIGGGNIAEAIFSKLYNNPDLEIVVTQRNQEKLKSLSTKYPNIKFTPDLDFITNNNDIIILAIKPLDAQDTCKHLKEKIRESTVVSIMTGITTTTLAKWLDNNKIARVMPNTPVSVGLGASGIYNDKHVPLSHQQLIKRIFLTVGTVYNFNDEIYIDKITAVTGSAPAYIYYFIESLIKSATDNFNFDKNIARDMTIQVIKGSIAMIENNPTTEISNLREKVTSKKGTTEQAIAIFEKYNLPQIIKEAEVACYNRAKEISQNFI